MYFFMENEKNTSTFQLKSAAYLQGKRLTHQLTKTGSKIVLSNENPESLAKSAMHAASQLPGRGPTDVDIPLYLRVNQKSDDDDD